MSKLQVSIIAAIGRNREIGGGGGLLWHIPEDFKHFKKATMGKPIIMGSTTYESIGKALPGRLNIVLSHLSDYKASGCKVVHSLDEALELAEQDGIDEVFIIGGGFVYKQALEQGLVDRLYLTIIDADFDEADVFFPGYSDFNKVINERVSKDEHFVYKFVTLERDDRYRADN